MGAGGVESCPYALLEYLLIILLCVHKPLDGNALSMRTICDEVLFEITYSPETNAFVFSLANFAGSTHARHFGELCISFLNALSKAFCGIEARVLRQIDVVQDEIPPGRRTLNGPSHRLG